MSLALAQQALRRAQRLACLTGAGVSAASGIATFRGAGGLWRNYRAEDLATPQAYARDPELVWAWYQMRFEAVYQAEPNGAHLALAALEQTKELTLVTQNVDDLHRRAGSQTLLELHGNLSFSRCERCRHLDKLEPGFSIPPTCSVCGRRARPNVVWFGETLPQAVFEKAVQAFAACDAALIIGTSALVEPAASLGRLAKSQGAFVIELNPDATPLSRLVDAALRLDAVEGMRALTEI